MSKLDMEQTRFARFGVHIAEISIVDRLEGQYHGTTKTVPYIDCETACGVQ